MIADVRQYTARSQHTRFSQLAEKAYQCCPEDLLMSQKYLITCIGILNRTCSLVKDLLFNYWIEF